MKAHCTVARRRDTSSQTADLDVSGPLHGCRGTDCATHEGWRYIAGDKPRGYVGPVRRAAGTRSLGVEGVGSSVRG
jgi:hypothetical protein